MGGLELLFHTIYHVSSHREPVEAGMALMAAHSGLAAAIRRNGNGNDWKLTRIFGSARALLPVLLRKINKLCRGFTVYDVIY